MAASSEPQAKRVKIDAPPATDANECTTFTLLQRVGEQVVLEEDGQFQPEMSHQLFEDETIQGYDGLEIDMFFTPRFQALLDVKYAARSPGATNLSEPFKSAFPAGFFTEKAAFDEALQTEPDLQLQELGQEVATSTTQEGTQLHIVRSNLSQASETVRLLHARLQPLLLFFVDAASAIDPDDRNWDLLLVVETAGGDVAPKILGFATLYHFWVFPDRRRVRLSQVLVLPPYQGRGAGSLLMLAAQKVAVQIGAVDLTLEDPTDALQRMRDRANLNTMLDTPWLKKEAEQSLAAALSDKGKAAVQDSSEGGSSLVAPPELLARLQSELLLGKGQARRMWEALLYCVALREGEGRATAAVEGMIRSGLEAQVAGAKQDSRGKTMKDTDSGFVMFRGAAGKHTPLGGAPVEQVTGAEQAKTIEGLVALRVAEMRRVLGLKAEGEEGEDGEEST